ncbi:hypothetical protein F5880DRAFT_1619197 [Lentinula raphanica]|nr:hypothetical protein F5880DRAFT_1619197 [Lentinula raphanica]
MAPTYFRPSQSIAQISWPSERISACLCNECDYSIHLDTPSLDFPGILARTRSGYNPTASERMAYLGMLEKTRSEIDRREGELRRLRKAMKKLKEQQKLLQAYEVGIRHLSSPIQSLPLEILGIILRYVCCGNDAMDIANSYRHDIHHRGVKNRLPSFDASGVCFKWHNFVTSTPMLWSSFGHDAYNPVSQSLVQIFIDRSCLNLIDFSLTDWRRPPTTRGIPRKAIVPTAEHRIKYLPSPVVAHCNRWRHVLIAGQFKFLYNSFLEPLMENIETPSNLISLDLECYRVRGYNPPLIEFPIVFHSLESLAIRGLNLNFGTPQYTVTTLCLSNMTCVNALSFLQKFPNIERLTVDKIDVDNLSTYAPLVLDKVQTLTLIFPFFGGAAGFLTAIKFPCLAYLYLDHLVFWPNPESHSVLSFFDQDCFTLTSLSIKTSSFRYEELLQLFRRLPSLTHLYVEKLIDKSPENDTMRWILNLLAASQHLGMPQGLQKAKQEVDNHADGSLSNDDDSEDHGREIRELLLPQLAELSLYLRKPHIELLLNLVRSRRPRLQSSPENFADRGCLRTLRVRYDPVYSHGQEDMTPEHLDALRDSLRPFEEEGLDVAVEVSDYR